MKRIIFIGIILVFGTFDLRAQGIKFFEGTFDEAKALAKKENKHVFVDCYSKYCGPCRQMERDVFPLKDVGDYYNEHFVCVKYDIDNNSNGKKIAEKYQVKAVPTYLYLDDKGEVIHKIEASRQPKAFIESGKATFDANNNLIGLIKRFEGGEHDTAFLVKFIKATNRVDQKECEKALSIYWDAIPIEDLWKEETFKIWEFSEEDIHSKAYKYIYPHWDQFLEKFVLHRDYKIFGPMAEVAFQTFYDRVYAKAAKAIVKAAEDNDSDLFNEAKKIAGMAKYGETKYQICIFEIKYYKLKGTWEPFYRDADAYINNYVLKDSTYFIFDNIANQILDNRIEDIGMLNKAVYYCERCISYGKSKNNMETYARVLFRLKRYRDATNVANEAIEIAKKDKEDFESINDLLADINKSMKGGN